MEALKERLVLLVISLHDFMIDNCNNYERCREASKLKYTKKKYNSLSTILGDILHETLDSEESTVIFIFLFFVNSRSL